VLGRVVAVNAGEEQLMKREIPSKARCPPPRKAVTDKRSRAELSVELEELRARLAEAEEALGAIRHGNFDALVVSGGRLEPVVAAERLARSILEQATEAVLVCDAQGRIIRASQAARRLCDDSPLLLLFAAVLPLRIDGSVPFDLAPVLQGETVGDVDVSLDRAGQRLDLILHAGPLIEGEALLGCIVTLTDITRRKRAEEALRTSLEDFRSLAEAMPQIVFITRPDGWNVFTNQQWVDYTGLAREESMGHGWDTAFHPEDTQRARDAWQKATSEGGIYALEARLRGADGTYRWWLVRGVPLLDGDGHILKWYGTGTDIHDLKMAQLEIVQTNQVLSESERRFSELLDNVELVAMMLDTEGRITYCNEYLLRLTGWQRAEVIGRDWFEVFVPPELPDLKGSSFAALLANQAAALHHENEILTRSGGRRLIRFNNMVLRSSVGDVVGTASIGVDITESKQAEEARKLHAVELEESQRIARIGSWQWTPATGVITWSEGMNQVLARAPDLPAPTFEALPSFYTPESWERLQAAIATTIETGAPFDLDLEMLRADGDTCWTTTRGEAVRGPEGTVVSLHGTVHDITERKRGEERLALLAMAVEQSAESIMITDPDGVIQYVNPAFERITCYTRKEALGQNPRLLKSGKQDPEFYRRMWDTLTQGDFWDGRLINKKKDGTLYEEEATISPVKDDEGRTVNYVAAKRDITREVELEVEMRQAQKMEAVGVLAGGVAHDFNNILAVIMMEADLTGMSHGLPADVREGLKEIKTATKRAADLTRQLLLFSRRQVMQSRALDLNGVVTNLVKMLGRIVGEDVDIQLDLSPRPLITHADAGMLEQVLMNLVVNGRDAMPKGGRIVIATDDRTFTAGELSLIPGATPGRYVRLRVTDSGGGIRPGDLPHIFEPFFTTKETGKGSGLGLATVFGIVKQHKGWITVDSEVGQGATLRMMLPAAEAAEAAPVVVLAKPEPRRGTETIILVEDDPAVRVSMRRVLATHGYQVLEAEDGVGALRIWAKHGGSIDLLLTDMVMPKGISGRALAAQLRERDPRLAVVFTSGYSPDVAGAELGLDEGQAFLQKPSSPEEILGAVRQCLDARAGAAGARARASR